MAERVPPRLLLSPPGLLAFGFGSGLVPGAPGTAGTLMAVPIYLAMRSLPQVYYLALLGLFFLAGIWFCQHAAEALGVHDHPAIVWDEIVGFLVTMAFAPAGWVWLLAGFSLFRLFDIAKPWPIRWCDRQVRGGFGIMFDDLLAGVYAAGVLLLAARLAG